MGLQSQEIVNFKKFLDVFPALGPYSQIRTYWPLNRTGVSTTLIVNGLQSQTLKVSKNNLILLVFFL